MTQKIKNETRIVNSFHGWQGETITTDKAQDLWKITTMKRSSGFVSSVAIKIDKAEQRNGMRIVSMSMMGMINNKITLLSEKTRATEKTIREMHLKAVVLFDEQDTSTPVTEKQKEIKNPVQVGLEFFMWGYCKEDQKLYITEINEHGFRFINSKTLDFGFGSHLSRWSEKFGIGYYYNDKQTNYMSDNDMANLICDGLAKKAQLDKANEQAAQETQNKINAFIDKVEIPEGAIGVIVGELMVDESDIMTDYFSSSSSQTIYLDWTFKKRDDFREMRKAALNSEHTQFLNDCDKEWENREKYTGGFGYYLGESRYRGWVIKKNRYMDLTHSNARETFALAMAEGRFFIPEAESKKKNEAPTVEAVEAEGLELIQYSDRAHAIFGNTKEYKDILGKNGLKLRFNYKLVHPVSKETTAGWILPSKRLDEVKQALNIR